MSNYVISLDPGKDSSKAIGLEMVKDYDPSTAVRNCFRTRMYDLANGHIDVDGENSFKTIFNDKSFIVGNGGGQKRSYNTSKLSALHQLCSYVAITRYLKPGTKDNKVYLVLACPISMIVDKVAKEEYKTFIKGNGPIKLEVAGENFEFEIMDITLKAEGSGLLYLTPEIFRHKIVGVADFGGLNLTFSVFNNGICVNPKKDRFSEECGGILLVNYVADSLSRYNKGNIINYETAEQDLFRGWSLNFGQKDEASIGWINKAESAFFNEACDLIERHGVELKHLDNVVCIGGTTQYLTHEIATSLPNHVITDDLQWVNVKGLFVVALKKYKNV